MICECCNKDKDKDYFTNPFYCYTCEETLKRNGLLTDESLEYQIKCNKEHA